MTLLARHSASVGSIRIYKNYSSRLCLNILGHLHYSWERFAAIRCASNTQFLCLLSQPRSLVGSAFRNDPSAPFVSCYRIIASNLYICRGGEQFDGSIQIHLVIGHLHNNVSCRHA
ncbi:hypothetical protein CY34DRAFT_91667 [Suillus luteus UH-Slu-Lm8-n1]|uniref:Uncharacterized protein n=1 Tax=Suillus luteus UH-Slu-Lm8-n1 TaxID=930992 RepID=A0A0D0AIU9_9AGAM|nr:hypothetical protein CY34DRAFT_91667 [Suillus luteus UH-Slu-Lm8-n1]